MHVGDGFAFSATTIITAAVIVLVDGCIVAEQALDGAYSVANITTSISITDRVGRRWLVQMMVANRGQEGRRFVATSKVVVFYGVSLS